MYFIVIKVYPDAAVLAQELSEEFEARIHHVEPGGVFEVVVVMLERGAGVVRRIDVDALHPPLILREQRLERIQIVAVDDHVAVIVMAFGGKGILLLQRAERHVQMMIDHLVFSNPVQRGHKGRPPRVIFLAADILLKRIISDNDGGVEAFF